ncbi:hypothetical protein [Exilibacterium tricleocarpae]|uniref:hypothetical protein n=1 Tax=Exilibacterium tricleocarpae TaxID=2591008 RepID=UPI00115E9DDE|nr:hypothetical protein [Exilibacterium tricleocarpae]
MGEDRSGRAYAYRELFQSALAEEDLHMVRKATHYNHPVGDDGFCQAIEEKYGITLGNMSIGRPKKGMDGK